MGKARLTDPSVMIQAGINPKTKLPVKMDGGGNALKYGLKKLFSIIDRQDAVNRYTWHNLPEGLTSQMMERILYYKGQAAFFYIKELDRFFFLPFALDGGIDVYGRYMGITPLPFNGSTQVKKGLKTEESPWIDGLIRTPIYDVVLPEDLTEKHLDEACVIIRDYTQGIPQTIEAREMLNDPLLELMSDIPCYARTALLNGTGINGMRVNDQSAESNVEAASRSVNDAALAGKKWIATISTVEMQELSAGNVSKAEEYLMTLQSMDNIRLGTYGLENGGIFQKKAHMLDREMELNGSGQVGSPLQDGLTHRQEQANIINSIWGLGTYCEISENAVDADMDGDGIVSDEQNQTGTPGEEEGFLNV